jgi:hypothetical protein
MNSKTVDLNEILTRKIALKGAGMPYSPNNTFILQEAETATSSQ